MRYTHYKIPTFGDANGEEFKSSAFRFTISK